MRKVYLDQTEATMCMSVFVNDAEVVLAGATVSSMSVKHKNSEYQRYADDYDIHFVFDDNIPALAFYTIPQVDIFAVDSSGGYIVSLGQAVSFSSDIPICYIDKNQNCFVIAENGKKFLENVQHWKEHTIPCKDVEFFASKEEAQSKYEFLNRQEMEQPLRTISRIQRMERYLDDVLRVKHTCPGLIKEDAGIQKKIQVLTEYYESGQWLQDYDSDSRGELPADLKRGVLAQDTLYDLLAEIKELEA